jgi:hypothetical protein
MLGQCEPVEKNLTDFAAPNSHHPLISSAIVEFNIGIGHGKNSHNESRNHSSLTAGAQAMSLRDVPISEGLRRERYRKHHAQVGDESPLRKPFRKTQCLKTTQS